MPEDYEPEVKLKSSIRSDDKWNLTLMLSGEGVESFIDITWKIKEHFLK